MLVVECCYESSPHSYDSETFEVMDNGALVIYSGSSELGAVRAVYAPTIWGSCIVEG